MPMWQREEVQVLLYAEGSLIAGLALRQPHLLTSDRRGRQADHPQSSSPDQVAVHADSSRGTSLPVLSGLGDRVCDSDSVGL